MITEVAKITGVSESEILGIGRHPIVCEARQLYWMVLCNNGFTLKGIGRLCEKNHATVLQGIRHLKGLLDTGDVKLSIWCNAAKKIKR